MLPFPDQVDVRLRLGNDVGLGRQLHAGRGDKPLQRHPVMVFQLLDVPALLARLEALCAAVGHQPDVLRTLDHPVEVIGPHAVLVFEGRQAEALPEFRRDEGSAGAPARERALVRGEQDDVPEIQGARLQRAHHLQALQRFAPERDGLAGEQFVQQAQPGGRQDVQGDVAEQVQRLHAPLREIQFQQHLLHAAELPAHIADDVGEVADQQAVLAGGGLLRPGDDRPEQQVQQRPSLQVRLRDVVLRLGLDGLDDLFLLRRQDGAEQAVGKDGPDLAVVEVPFAGLFPQMLLHRGHGRDEGVDGAARERAAHRHVDMGMLRRDGIQQGHQEVLVRQDEGRLHRILRVAAREDFGGEFRLAHGRRHAHDMEGRLPEAVRIHRKGVREVPDILPHEDGRLVPGVAHGVGDEVPAELRQARVAEAPQDRLLALVQGVHAHEHEPLRLREHGPEDVGHGLAALQALGQVAVHHPLIGHSLRPQAPAEVLIERIEDVPDLEETGLHGGVVRIQADGQAAVPVTEMVHEMQDGLPLDLRQVAVVVLDVLEVRNLSTSPKSARITSPQKMNSSRGSAFGYTAL